MVKFDKTIKNVLRRISVLFVIVSMISYTFTFGAVSSNDGSAFITKAEFDAMVNTFNEQMDSYQSSLNSKIDGAIANYLAGLSSYQETTIKSNLDENGKLSNGIKLTWSGSDSKYFGYNLTTQRVAIESFSYSFVWRQSNSTNSSSNRYSWNKYDLKEKRGYTDEYSNANRNYLTSQLTTIKLNNGNSVNGFRRRKVRCELMWNMAEIHMNENATAPATGWTPWVTGTVETYIGSIYQNTSGLQIANSNTPNTGGWHQDGTFSVKTYDISDEGETYEYDELMCPYSESKELYWDKTDNNTALKLLNSTSATREWGTATNEQAKWPGTTNVNNRPTTGAGVRTYDAYEVPWLEKEVIVKDMYLYNLNQVDNRHRQIKNGVIIADTQGAGKYTITASSDVDGTFYCYIGETPISNWKEEGFTGKKVRMSDTTKQYSLEFDITSTKKGVPMWVLFLLADSAKIGTLKINEIKLVTE